MGQAFRKCSASKKKVNKIYLSLTDVESAVGASLVHAGCILQKTWIRKSKGNRCRFLHDKLYI
jgi:hypothetical protein